MKKIQKTISLETLKSRIDSVIPTSNEPTILKSNYGLIPYDVQFNSIWFSFQKLANYYHFFLKNKIYSPIESNKMGIFFQDLQQNIEWNNINQNIIKQKDLNDFITFIFDKCFPTFFIDEGNKDAWSCDYLTYSDIIKWSEWANSLNYCNTEDIKAKYCCECEKYEKLGGNTFFYKLNTYITNKLNSITFQNDKTKSSSIIIPLTLINSIDDIGNISIIKGNENNNIEYKNINISQPISGYANSKLSLFLNEKMLVHDDVGNIFFGCYNSNPSGYTEEITSGDILALPYQSGMFSSLEELGENMYWGNFIESITDTNNEKTIIYYIGTLLNKNGNNYSLKKTNGKFFGVKYTDTFSIERKSALYHKVNDNFIIYYNDLIHKATRFEYYSNFIVNETNDIVENTNQNNIFYIREEHNFGKSSKEKINANIYINRGLSRANDSHLRLLEVKSLESLEQTGNGFFNII